MRYGILGTLTVLFFTTGCEGLHGHGSGHGIDPAAAKAALMEADRAWYRAYAASDDPLGATVGQFLEDSRVLAPDAPIAVGKDAVAALFGELESMPGFSLRWEPTHADVGSGNDLGYTIGTYHMEFQGPDGNLITDDGKYLSVWKRGADGEWMVAVDMFNGNGGAEGH